MKKIIQPIILLVLCINLHAQTTLYFTGAVNNNWSTTGNWSATSGGSSSGTVPTTTTTTIFDNNSPKCKIESTLTTKRIVLESTYTDTIIVKDSITMTLTDTLIQKSGVFVTKTATINLQKGILQAAGSYYASKAITTFGGCIKLDGNFYHNNGKIMFDRLTNIYTDILVYDFDFGGSGGFSVNIAQNKVMTVENDLRFVTPTSSGTKNLNGPGKIHLKKDLYQASPNGTTDLLGSITIVMNGTSDQNIYGNNLNTATLCNLHKIEINKSSGTLYLRGILSSFGGFDLISGNFDASTYMSTLRLIGSQTFSYPISFYNLNIVSYNTATALNVDTLADITVLHDLKLLLQHTANTKSINGPGRIKVQGDMYQAIPNGTSNFNGNIVFCMTGSSNQHLYGNNDLTSTTASLHKIEINKSSGILYLHDAMTSNSGFNLISGTVDPKTYNSTVQLVNSMIFTNDFVFNHLIFYARTAGSISISINQGKTLKVLGNLTYNALSTSTVSNTTLNGPGSLELYGNLTTVQNGIAVNAGAGNALIKLVGFDNQSIIGNTTEGLGKLPNILVDKDAGKVELSKIISVHGDFQVYDDSGSGLDSSKLILSFSQANLATGSNFELFDLKLNTNPINLSGNVNLRGTFDLHSDRLYLNGNTLTINNESENAIINGSSGIYPSSDLFKDVIKWKSSNTQGVTYSIPFKTVVANNDITYSISIDTPGVFDGGIMYNIVSTYSTASDNLPYPPGIDSFLDTTGSNNSKNIVDRYYRIAYQGFSQQPSSTIVCKYKSSEFATPNTITESNIRAQIFDGNTISNPLGSVNTSTNEVTITNYNYRDGLIILGSVLKPTSIKTTINSYYAALSKSLDASYYNMVGSVNFLYNEKYNEKLKFKIYNCRHEIVVCSDAPCAYVLSTSSIINIVGDNFHVIPVNTILNNNEYYTLEVINEKGEVYQMRFLFKKI